MRVNEQREDDITIPVYPVKLDLPMDENTLPLNEDTTFAQEEYARPEVQYKPPEPVMIEKVKVKETPLVVIEERVS